MSFTLKIHGVFVGRSELEHRNPSQRLRWGRFRSGAGYALVEPVFALRSGEPERYRKARSALPLELFDANGALVSTSSLEITPDDADPNELLLRTRIDDASFWG